MSKSTNLDEPVVSRPILKWVAPLVAGVAVALTILGVAAFLSAFLDWGVPVQYFWFFFLGVPMTLFGFWLIRVAYLPNVIPNYRRRKSNICLACGASNDQGAARCRQCEATLPGSSPVVAK